MIDVEQTFISHFTHPLEISFEIPIDKEYTIGQLTAQIGEQIIEGKILKKERAIERYEDAIASGHTVLLQMRLRI